MRILIYIMIPLSLLIVAQGCNPGSNGPVEPRLVSEIVTSPQGKTYLEVEGNPFLYNSVQSWFPPEADYEIYMQKTAEVNYRVFCFWLLWAQLEPEEGKYDWTSIDRVIDLANTYDLRLDIVWGGSSFCGAMDPRFVPSWLMERDDLKVKNAYGQPVLTPQGDVGFWPHMDYSNPEAFEIESRMVAALMNHLYEYDTNNRVIFFQVENEPNLPGRVGSHEWSKLHDMQLVLDYCNRIGKVVKESPYRIATRVNWSGQVLFEEAYDLKYIDCQGPDVYTDDIEVVRKFIKQNKGFGHIAENSAYRNSSSLITAALAAGGFYNIYRLDYDHVWKKPGIWDDHWGYLKRDGAVTYDILALNAGLNKIGRLITISTSDNFLEFNTEESYPKWNYDTVKTFKGIQMGFRNSGFSGDGEPVGMVVADKMAYYLLADKNAWFSFGQKPRVCESGGLDSEGNWVKMHEKEYIETEDGMYQVYYDLFDCIQVSF